MADSTRPAGLARGRCRARAWGFGLALAVGIAALGYHVVVPDVVARELRARLAAAGYQDARFEIASIDLHRLALEDVWLRDGVELGDVEVAAGLWQLWRGGPHDVVLHGPRVDARELAPPRAADGSARPRPPLGRILVEDGTLAVGRERIKVRGSLDLRQEEPSVDLEATSQHVRLGDTTVRDVVAKVRGRTSELRACLSGTVDDARATACTTLPGLDPDHLKSLDVTWTAHDPDRASWSARGAGRVTYDGATLALADGTTHVDIDDAVIGGRRFTATTVRAEVTGDLTRQELVARGTMRARRVDASSYVLRDASLPFAIRATRVAEGYQITSAEPFVIAAAGADLELRGKRVPFEDTTITARGAIALGRTRIAAGSPRDQRSERMHLRLGLRDVSLEPLLQVATDGRLQGTGVLDGHLDIEVAPRTWAITKGALRARGHGALRVTDASLRRRAASGATGLAVHQRIAAALTEFEYTRLDLVLGEDPDLRVSMFGRGKRVQQEIDLVMDIRGVRRVADRLGFANTMGGR